MRKKSVSKSAPTKVQRMQIRKLTPGELTMIAGGCGPKCDGGPNLTCISYIVRDTGP